MASEYEEGFFQKWSHSILGVLRTSLRKYEHDPVQYDIESMQQEGLRAICRVLQQSRNGPDTAQFWCAARVAVRNAITDQIRKMERQDRPQLNVVLYQGSSEPALGPRLVEEQEFFARVRARLVEFDRAVFDALLRQGVDGVADRSALKREFKTTCLNRSLYRIAAAVVSLSGRPELVRESPAAVRRLLPFFRRGEVLGSV